MALKALKKARFVWRKENERNHGNAIVKKWNKICMDFNAFCATI